MATFNEAISAFVATTSGAIFPVDYVVQTGDNLGFPVSKLAFGTTGTATLVSATNPFPIVSASSGVVQLSSQITVTSTAATNPWSSAPGFNVPIISASSGLVQISGQPLVLVATSGNAFASNISVVSASSGVVQLSSQLTVTSTAATNPWSSAPGFNVPIVSASSGLVQISGTPTVTATAATNPWSSAPGFNVPIVSASSGLVQISGTPTVTSTAATNPWSSAPGFNMPVVSASSGTIQLVPLSTQGTVSGLSLYHAFSTGGAGSANIKGTPGTLYGWNMSNSTAGALAFHFYNTTSAPTVGSTSNLMMGGLVPGTTGGAGNNMAVGAHGVYFSGGIGITLTANMNDTDTGTAGNNSMQVNVWYV